MIGGMLPNLLVRWHWRCAPLLPRHSSTLFNHRLDGWEVIGDGVWHVLSDGTLVGERDLRPVLRDAPFLHPGGSPIGDWLNVQSWLYTKRNDFAHSI